MSTENTHRYYEDVEVGTEFTFGDYTTTKAEIVEFARQFDPQPFHVDEQAARDSMFGGLVASGWYTAAVCMRLLVEGLLEDFARAAGRGVDDLRWHRPVHPGDELSIHVEFVEKTPSSALPGMGEMHARITGTNQNDETVVTWTHIGIVERREG